MDSIKSKLMQVTSVVAVSVLLSASVAYALPSIHGQGAEAGKGQSTYASGSQVVNKGVLKGAKKGTKVVKEEPALKIKIGGTILAAYVRNMDTSVSGIVLQDTKWTTDSNVGKVWGDYKAVSNSGFYTDARLHFSGSSVMANGMEASVYTRLRLSKDNVLNSGVVIADRYSMALKTMYGKVAFGTVISPADELIGGVAWADYIDDEIDGLPATSDLLSMDSTTDQKIVYYAPATLGMQMGISYTPRVGAKYAKGPYKNSLGGALSKLSKHYKDSAASYMASGDSEKHEQYQFVGAITDVASAVYSGRYGTDTSRVGVGVKFAKDLGQYAVSVAVSGAFDGDFLSSVGSSASSSGSSSTSSSFFSNVKAQKYAVSAMVKTKLSGDASLAFSARYKRHSVGEGESQVDNIWRVGAEYSVGKLVFRGHYIRAQASNKAISAVSAQEETPAVFASFFVPAYHAEAKYFRNNAAAVDGVSNVLKELSKRKKLTKDLASKAWVDSRTGAMKAGRYGMLGSGSAPVTKMRITTMKYSDATSPYKYSLADGSVKLKGKVVSSMVGAKQIATMYEALQKRHAIIASPGDLNTDVAKAGLYYLEKKGDRVIGYYNMYGYKSNPATALTEDMTVFDGEGKDAYFFGTKVKQYFYKHTMRQVNNGKVQAYKMDGPISYVSNGNDKNLYVGVGFMKTTTGVKTWNPSDTVVSFDGVKDTYLRFVDMKRPRYVRGSAANKLYPTGLSGYAGDAFSLSDDQAATAGYTVFTYGGRSVDVKYVDTSLDLNGDGATDKKVTVKESVWGIDFNGDGALSTEAVEVDEKTALQAAGLGRVTYANYWSNRAMDLDGDGKIGTTAAVSELNVGWAGPSQDLSADYTLRAGQTYDEATALKNIFKFRLDAGNVLTHAGAAVTLRTQQNMGINLGDVSDAMAAIAAPGGGGVGGISETSQTKIEEYYKRAAKFGFVPVWANMQAVADVDAVSGAYNLLGVSLDGANIGSMNVADMAGNAAKSRPMFVRVPTQAIAPKIVLINKDGGDKRAAAMGSGPGVWITKKVVSGAPATAVIQKRDAEAKLTGMGFSVAYAVSKSMSLFAGYSTWDNKSGYLYSSLENANRVVSSAYMGGQINF